MIKHFFWFLLLIISQTVYSQSVTRDKFEKLYKDYSDIVSISERINSRLEEYFVESFFFNLYCINDRISGIAIGDFKTNQKTIIFSMDNGKLYIENKTLSPSFVKFIEPLYNKINQSLLQNIVNKGIIIEKQYYGAEHNDFIFSSFKDIVNNSTHNLIHYGTFYFGEKNSDLNSFYIICYDVLVRLSKDSPKIKP